MDDATLRKEMEGLTFYHTIPLTPTLSTPGWPLAVPIVEMTSQVLSKLDVRGKRVLDVGCRDGYFCFEAEKHGAGEVVGIDHNLTNRNIAFLLRVLHSRATIRSMTLYDLRPETFGKFDVVIFPGVLYHLRYPFWALKLIRDVLVEDGVLVLETAILADDNQYPTLFCPCGKDSPYEPSSCTFFNRRGLHDTLVSMGFKVGASVSLMNLPEKSTKCVPPNSLPIDRTTLTCKKDSSALSQLNRYWDDVPNVPTTPGWGNKKSA